MVTGVIFRCSYCRSERCDGNMKDIQMKRIGEKDRNEKNWIKRKAQISEMRYLSFYEPRGN